MSHAVAMSSLPEECSKSKKLMPTAAASTANNVSLLKTMAQVEAKPSITVANNQAFPPYYNIAVAEQQAPNNDSTSSASTLNSGYATTVGAPDILTAAGTNGTRAEIELVTVDSTYNSGTEPPLHQSPKTLPRSHGTSRRHNLHTDIHSASASPNLSSRTAQQQHIQQQINHYSCSPMPSPKPTQRARNCSAGIASDSTDPTSLQLRLDSESGCGGTVGTIQEVMQQKVSSKCVVIWAGLGKESPSV